MAAAEGTAGTIGPGSTGPRLGLKSVLFLRERGLLELAETPDLSGGRTGEVSRDGFGELAADVEGKEVVVDALLRTRGFDEGCCGVVVPERGPSFPFTSCS